MRKILILFFVSLLCTLSVQAIEIAPINENANINVPIVSTPVPTAMAEELPVYEKSYRWSGETLDINGHFMNDVAVAGNNIVIDGIVEGDVLAAGNFITIKGQINGDIRVAGNNVAIDAIVKKNVTAFGNNISISQGSIIEKDVAAFGNTVNIDGQIKGEVVKQTGDSKQAVKKEKESRFAKYTEASYWLWSIMKLFWLLIVGLILVALGKNWLARTTEKMFCCPGNSLLYGILGVLLTPLAVVIICLTIIGIPLGFIVLILYIILIYISAIFVGTAIGKKLLPKAQSLIWPMLLGTIIFHCVNGLPYLGGFITFLASCWAIGAIINKKCDCRHE